MPNDHTDIIKKTLGDIALEKLKEIGNGFYSIDFLYFNEQFQIEAEAGVTVEPWLKISSTLFYEPITGNFIAGLRIGGEIKI
jgi:hypothetical protein